MDDITKKRQGKAIEGLGEHIVEGLDAIHRGVDQFADQLGEGLPDNWARKQGLKDEGFYYAYIANHTMSFAAANMERHGLTHKDAMEYFRRTLDMIEKLHEAGVLGEGK